MQVSAGALPIYHRIASVLREEIVTGRLPPGERLATIKDMADRYQVAPDTVRQAITVLRGDGLVRSRQGSGTFVADAPPMPKSKVIAMDWPDFMRDISGHTARVLETDDRSPILLPREGRPAPAYQRMLRIHSDADGTAYGLAEIFLDRRHYVKARRRFETKMVLTVLEEIAGSELAELRQQFAVGAADPTTAAHLGVEVGAPIGRVRRALCSANGEVAYLSIGAFRGDAVAFETVIRGPAASAG